MLRTKKYICWVIGFLIMGFLSACNTYKDKRENILVELKNDEVLKITMETKVKGIELYMDYGGTNAIYGLSKIIYPKDELIIGTDWIGPYIMKSHKSVDSEVQQFTGGWHGDNGDGTGNPTAFTDQITILCDGKPISDKQSLDGQEIKVYVKNYIHGYNTETSILLEEVEYTISYNNIHVRVQGTALEDLSILKYYGMQSQNYLWNEQVTYWYASGKTERQGTDFASQSKDKKDDRVIMYTVESTSDTSRALHVIMEGHGLGSFDYVRDELPTAFTTAYGKSYYNLVNDKALYLREGESFTWQGRYLFE